MVHCNLDVFVRRIWVMLFEYFLYMWVKKYVESCVYVFKILKNLLKINYQSLIFVDLWIKRWYGYTHYLFMCHIPLSMSNSNFKKLLTSYVQNRSTQQSQCSTQQTIKNTQNPITILGFFSSTSNFCFCFWKNQQISLFLICIKTHFLFFFFF